MSLDYSYIQNNLKENSYRLIGSGSGRKVYDLGNGYVVKVAMNRKGIAQNEAENYIASSDNSDLFARIQTMSKDSIMLIMEKADRIRSISEVWRYYKVRNNWELFQRKEFRDIIIKHKLQRADLCRASSWGMVKGKIVIIDYGFTKEVRNRYYSLFRFG